MAVHFYESVEDDLLKFAVILAVHHGKYVFCKHRARSTWEIPGGHREAGEAIADTARRELYEETGAVDFTIQPICVYSVLAEDRVDSAESYGMLYFADIQSFETELHREIEKIVVTDHLPARWTYPQIQPLLMDEARRRGVL